MRSPLEADPDRAGILAATLGAAAMIAHQVGGKATRDALFLGNFDVEYLPRMLAASALLSVPVVLGTARLLSRHGPQRVVPISFLASAAALLGLWAASFAAPRATAILVYLHVASFGAVLVSGFWSLMNERFDPRTARRRFHRVAAGGTAGGLAGGLLAAGVGRLTAGSATMLPLLAVLHLLCAWMVGRILVSTTTSATGSDDAAPTSLKEGMRVLNEIPYLRHLAGLIVVGTLGAACLDFVFKASAQEAFGRGHSQIDLITFFGIFHTGVSLLTLSLQAGLGAWCLERLGLASTAATLPSGMALGSLVAMALPVWPAVSAARGLENSLRHSLFRSAYEPLYTPLAPREKRASKTIIDVGLERTGDAVGAGLVQAVVWLTPTATLLLVQERILLGLAVVFGLAGLWISARLQQGYVEALEKRLLHRVVEIDQSDVVDSTTRSVLSRSRMDLEIPESLRRDFGASETPAESTEAANPAEPDDPMTAALLELRSRDAGRVRRALRAHRPFPRELVETVVDLLAWDEVADQAIEALRAVRGPVAGLLLDRLLDGGEDFAIRRRIPRALPSSDSPVLVTGLVRGLRAERFEIRYQCGLALRRVHQDHPGVEIPESEIHAVLLDEVRVDRRVWESHRLLDPHDEQTPFLEKSLRRRSNRSLEHVFTLLSLMLPEQPLLVAYKGILTEDRALRGTALEYLDSVVPADVRASLWPLLDAPSRGLQKVDEEERKRRLEELLRSNASIQLSLEELRRHEREGPD